VKYKEVIYNDDICIDSKGQAKPRIREENHVIAAKELKSLLTQGVVAVVVGTGQSGCATLSLDFLELVEKKKLELHTYETPEAIKKYNEIAPTKKTIAIMHLTC
jgi:hypothetical protein